MCGYGGFGGFGGHGFLFLILCALGIAYFLSRSRFYHERRPTENRSDAVLEEIKKLRQEIDELKKEPEKKNE